MPKGTCPKCGELGSGPFEKWAKDKRFKYLYWAHRFKTDKGWKTRWCYLGPAEPQALEA